MSFRPLRGSRITQLPERNGGLRAVSVFVPFGDHVLLNTAKMNLKTKLSEIVFVPFGDHVLLNMMEILTPEKATVFVPFGDHVLLNE